MVAREALLAPDMAGGDSGDGRHRQGIEVVLDGARRAMHQALGRAVQQADFGRAILKEATEGLSLAIALNPTDLPPERARRHRSRRRCRDESQATSSQLRTGQQTDPRI